MEVGCVVDNNPFTGKVPLFVTVTVDLSAKIPVGQTSNALIKACE